MGQHIRYLLSGICFFLSGITAVYGQCVEAEIKSTDVSCAENNDGTIVITEAAGGSGIYEYSIDGGNTWQLHNTFTGLSSGVYNVQVRDASTPACIITLDEEREIFEPEQLDPGLIDTYPLQVCLYYDPDPLIFLVFPSGGREPYSYQWFLNGEPIADETGDSYDPPVITEPGTYTYYCRVTDNCLLSADTESKTITVLENFGITITGAGTYCQDTPVTLSAGFSGGTGTLTYQWQYSEDNISWLDIEGENNSDFFPSTSEPGYTYYRINLVYDGALCTETAQVNVNPLPAASISGTSEICQSNSTAIVTLTGSSGVSPYTFSYSINNSENQITTNSSGTSAELEIPAVSTGNFIINLTKVSDANGCSQDLSEEAVITVHGLPSAMIAETNDVLCHGDSTGGATVLASGGTGPYTYLWSTLPSRQTSTVTGLAAGTYMVTVTDSNGCTDIEQVTIRQPPSALLASIISSDDVLCPGDETGTAIVSASGGTVPYQYIWDTYPAQNSPAAINLGMGTYTVTVTDRNSCADQKTVIIGSVYESCMTIPEAFSPNGDGHNDYWQIEDIVFYPDAEITIYDRWNRQVWQSERGYPYPWDGTSNDAPLPVDSYHYFIELKKGRKPLLGHVTIVR